MTGDVTALIEQAQAHVERGHCMDADLIAALADALKSALAAIAAAPHDTESSREITR